MGDAEQKVLKPGEPVDVEELLAGMTDEQREAAQRAALAINAAVFVRRLREHKGLERRGLAALAGLDEQQLIDIEMAKNSEAPSVSLLARIAAAVGEELSIGLRGEPDAAVHVYTISDVDAMSSQPAIPGTLLKGTIRASVVWLNEQQGYGIIKPESGGDDVLVRARAGQRLDRLHPGQRLAVDFEDDHNVRLILAD
jgi:cold shock CspA family protein